MTTRAVVVPVKASGTLGDAIQNNSKAPLPFDLENAIAGAKDLECTTLGKVCKLAFDA
jgi:hypothetical protein